MEKALFKFRAYSARHFRRRRFHSTALTTAFAVMMAVMSVACERATTLSLGGRESTEVCDDW